jgi:2-polyprenyl-3-methyl-5-hydroxy-6-metoxy-1,4-benzoquinol methylase
MIIRYVVRILKKGKKTLRYLSVKFLVRTRGEKYRLLWIDPSSVERTINATDKTLTGNSKWHIGCVQDGDWDLGGIPISEYQGVFPILRGCCVDHSRLETIPQYIENIEKIARGIKVDNSVTSDEYNAKISRTIQLYYKIQKEGYRTQKEMKSENPLDEIHVQIGRDGSILFEEGFHRLVIAQLLKLEKIPVVVYRRHRVWNDLRNAVIDIVAERGFFHQPFNHPDLDNVSRVYGTEITNKAAYGNDRWEFIESDLTTKGGSVLDIGAYAGYFCHRLEEKGFDCCAVENDPKNLRVLRQYRDIRGKKFRVLETSIFDIPEYKYDIVLALNIFHHLVRTEWKYEQFIQFLRKLDCRVMYFEPAPNEQSGAYRSFSDEEFIDLIFKNTKLRHVKPLGQAKEGRRLYRLSVE